MTVVFWVAALSKAPMMDFLTVNLLTESGGLVDILSCPAREGFLCFMFDRVVASVFYELSLSLLLTTIEANSKVFLSGVSTS